MIKFWYKSADWKYFFVYYRYGNFNWNDFVFPRVGELSIHDEKSIIRLLYEQLAIKTKQIYLHPIKYLSPWEITDKIFLIKKNDNELKTFVIIVSNKKIYIYIWYICKYMFIFIKQRITSLISFYRKFFNYNLYENQNEII